VPVLPNHIHILKLHCDPVWQTMEPQHGAVQWQSNLKNYFVVNINFARKDSFFGIIWLQIEFLHVGFFIKPVPQIASFPWVK